MERSIFLLAMICFGVGAGAQSLVPNGSFEEFETCPDSNFFGQWNLVEDWTSPYTPSVD